VNVLFVTVAVPPLKMAPAGPVFLLAKNVLSTTDSSPKFAIAPDALSLKETPAVTVTDSAPLRRADPTKVRSFAVKTAPLTANAALSSVIKSPPSMVVSLVIVLVPVPVLTSIVIGSGPQLNVTNPPPTRAVSRAVSVQLAGVPVPTTPAARTVDGAAVAKRTAHKTSKRPFERSA
jgi:hypothetical protein